MLVNFHGQPLSTTSVEFCVLMRERFMLTVVYFYVGCKIMKKARLVQGSNTEPTHPEVDVVHVLVVQRGRVHSEIDDHNRFCNKQFEQQTARLLTLLRVTTISFSNNSASFSNSLNNTNKTTITAASSSPPPTPTTNN